MVEATGVFIFYYWKEMTRVVVPIHDAAVVIILFVMLNVAQEQGWLFYKLPIIVRDTTTHFFLNFYYR